jgi:formamidopyrimidine-DNA glycosylase
VLRQARRSLVFGDQRQFGRVLYHNGQEPPIWWSALPPAILSPAFTEELVIHFLRRRKGAPLKAVLLMQERFPGIGNWMADEVLWRSRIRPAKRAGSLSKDQVAALYRTTRRVCRLAMESIDANWDFPASWLFPHRWEDGGRCPRCGTGLRRAVIGGRRSCWCPSCQK